MDTTRQESRLICIVGPTGSGKTAVAIRLAKPRGGEIISADSLQVYRHMDIGAAKPSPAERSQVPHHLIDCVEPHEPFNASLFVDKVEEIITARTGAGTPLFIVGGTGLYIKALLGGLIDAPASDEAIRSHYKELLKRHGKAYLYDLLKSRDPKAAGIIKAGDASRVIRALEVFDLSGKSIIDSQTQHGFRERRYASLKIGLKVDRMELYRRIDERTDRMMANGLEQEVRRLMEMGYDETHKPMRSLGYKHLYRYLTGRYDRNEAIRLMKRDTRNYAKRQMTWFSTDPEILWIPHEDTGSMAKHIDAFLQRPPGIAKSSE